MAAAVRGAALRGGREAAILNGVTPSLDLGLTGGTVADVRAGQVHRRAVGIRAGRIAAVGADEEIAARSRRVLDLAGAVVVPGYIEPHGHLLVASPTEFAAVLLRHGTTTAAVDALPLMMLARPDRLEGVLEHLAALPMKFRWLIRLHPQSFTDGDGRFAPGRLRALWRRPWAAGVGEVTRWFDVVLGDPQLRALIRAAREDGRPVEGHAPGASRDRLAALAAAGITSCHEAVTASEVRDRLEVGLAAMLRHSSIRPDLPVLLEAVTPRDIASGRVMLTADGPTPAFIARAGYLDHLARIAMDRGVSPLDALRMITYNPARYYGWDDLGEVAVGARADLNVLADLREPTPLVVISAGEVAVRDGRVLVPLPPPDWTGVFETPPIPHLAPQALACPPGRVGLRLSNDVITDLLPPDAVPPGALHLALVDRRGRWITRARLAGCADRLGGLATTLTSGFEPVAVLGSDPEDMARALRRLADLGGGVVVVEGGAEVFALRVDVGPYSSLTWEEVVEANRRFNALMRSRGYPFSDPLFTLLFLTFDALPWARVTSRGVWDVRRRQVVQPPDPL
ncbi:MAG: adenine deaminase C-terminal domain-containing protein [Armatimonadota bacterium]|nr:adenine deaminase C-terminal domain-containing protein [Armatimonadota bacterium]MDR7438115.1 adenine deaminase C-terminal domain-containing protein [Armatimonadota bacterium]MDR7472213.1 adenine deaminase C-terminal domain-containing protein [Armatimonadota bacterium]MDR7507714.1 adenine deaminase C-terminal domain-containing protein [Armatimonadota bacterium]MDR7510167.1 adenine deaminase C-terminal domain-containing protein [Armatimonadota bacterium]